MLRYQVRHINHTYINIVTPILGGQLWHGIWRIRWSMNRYWRSLLLWFCIICRYGWLLTNWRQLRWINYWIIQWRRHNYYRWWQLIDHLFTVLDIKSPVITRSFLWRSGRLLTNWGHLMWIDDWIFQWRTQIYQRWWQLIALWVSFLAIKSLVITRSCSLPTLIVPCYTFLVTANTF